MGFSFPPHVCETDPWCVITKCQQQVHLLKRSCTMTSSRFYYTLVNFTVLMDYLPPFPCHSDFLIKKLLPKNFQFICGLSRQKSQQLKWLFAKKSTGRKYGEIFKKFIAIVKTYSKNDKKPRNHTKKIQLLNNKYTRQKEPCANDRIITGGNCLQFMVNFLKK